MTTGFDEEQFPNSGIHHALPPFPILPRPLSLKDKRGGLRHRQAGLFPDPADAIWVRDGSDWA